jgi:hypothetical protein
MLIIQKINMNLNICAWYFCIALYLSNNTSETHQDVYRLHTPIPNNLVRFKKNQWRQTVYNMFTMNENISIKLKQLEENYISAKCFEFEIIKISPVKKIYNYIVQYFEKSVQTSYLHKKIQPLPLLVVSDPNMLANHCMCWFWPSIQHMLDIEVSQNWYQGDQT